MLNVRINSNGNTAESLLEELRVAHNAIVAAQAAMGRLTIHGRNYQTLDGPESAYGNDYGRKWENVKALADMSRYLVDCYTHIAAQLPSKGNGQ